MKTFLWFVGVIATVTLTAAAALVLVVRSGNEALIRRFTAFQRDVANPHVMKTAGETGDSNGVIEHVGRSSGRTYETPITPRPTEDGWVIGLPYGEQTQWAQNVLAAGSAFLRFDGERMAVTDIELVPVAATRLIRDEPMVIRAFGIRWAVQMKTAPAASLS